MPIHPYRQGLAMHSTHDPSSDKPGSSGRLPVRARTGRAARRGFTLLESALALVIIGVGITALIEAHTVLSRANQWSTQSATAAYLAGEIRERLRRLPRHDPVNGLFINGSNQLVGWGPDSGETTLVDYDDVDDYDGATFGATGNFPGPIDAQGGLIPSVDDRGQVIAVSGQVVPLAGWSQTVTVEKVDPDNFSVVRASIYVRPAVGPVPALGVDQFPLRVTVVVRFQGIDDLAPVEISRVTWIAP